LYTRVVSGRRNLLSVQRAARLERFDPAVYDVRMTVSSISHRADFALILSCDDTVGIVHAVSGFLVDLGCNIIDSAQFGDPDTRRFFMRVAFAAPAGFAGPTSADALRALFAPIAERFGMTFEIRDLSVKPRVAIMVSRHGHCLNDLLYRYGTNDLQIEIPAIISNHPDFAALAASYDIPFHHIPVTPATQGEAEAQLLEIVERERVDLLVLARYMRILSDGTARRLSGRAINIHHSFLPSFKGANPYAQAYARGVKLIGATAHYVTGDLDEGPIIEQDVARVDHASSVADFVAIGRDIECMVLARAVKFHIAQRVLPNGPRTVVFR
jgi:formyltetrahydrofolate deformylase